MDFNGVRLLSPTRRGAISMIRTHQVTNLTNTQLECEMKWLILLRSYGFCADFKTHNTLDMKPTFLCCINNND